MEEDSLQHIFEETGQENEGTETSIQEEEEEKEVDPRSLLTKEQVQYFKDIFDSFDQNKKEKISVKTIGFVLRLMGLNPTKAEIKKHMKEIDPQSKGKTHLRRSKEWLTLPLRDVNVKETFLLPIAQRINEEAETHEDIIAAFRIFDEEGNDYVYIDQLADYLTTLGEDLEDFELELFLKAAETKGTGKVHYVEFVEKMMGIVRKNAKDKKKDKKGKKKK